MRRPGRDGHIAARKLVLPLRARLHARQTPRNGGVDRLIIAELEMQERDVFGTAPVSTIKRVGANQVERPGNGHAVAIGEHQQYFVAHPLRQQREESARQIRSPPFAVAGVLIKSPESIPMPLGQVAARQVHDVQPRNGGGAFLADRFTLARGQCGKEIVEGRVPIIRPVKLGALTDQPTRIAKHVKLIVGNKVRMRPGHAVAVAQCLCAGDQRARGFSGARKQARPGNRRKRSGNQQLGVISPPGMFPRIGPTVIEHIFALAMGLCVCGRDTAERSVGIIKRNRQRLPAGTRANAARILKRRKESMADEGVIVPTARIPCRGIKSADGICYTQDNLRFGVAVTHSARSLGNLVNRLIGIVGRTLCISGVAHGPCQDRHTALAGSLGCRRRQITNVIGKKIRFCETQCTQPPDSLANTRMTLCLIADDQSPNRTRAVFGEPRADAGIERHDTNITQIALCRAAHSKAQRGPPLSRGFHFDQHGHASCNEAQHFIKARDRFARARKRDCIEGVGRSRMKRATRGRQPVEIAVVKHKGFSTRSRLHIKFDTMPGGNSRPKGRPAVFNANAAVQPAMGKRLRSEKRNTPSLRGRRGPAFKPGEQPQQHRFRP